MKNNELFRASGVMAIGTILSRITGFFRAILGVAVLGTALLADTYNVANTMPNILYNLLVGGALTAIFVPQLVRSFADEDGGDGFASRLVTTISGILLLLVIVGVIFAPALVRLYAPEFSTVGFETENQIAIAFTRYCLPQIFFLGLFTMLGQVANARGSFAPLMWAPIANNLVVIAVFAGVLLFQNSITLDTVTDAQIQLLGWGTTLGIIVQALILIPVVKLLISWLDFGLCVDFSAGVSSNSKCGNKCCCAQLSRRHHHRSWLHTIYRRLLHYVAALFNCHDLYCHRSASSSFKASN